MANDPFAPQKRVSIWDYCCLPALLILFAHAPYFSFLGLTRPIHYLVYPVFLAAFFLVFLAPGARKPSCSRPIATIANFFAVLLGWYVVVDMTFQWNRCNAPLRLKDALSCCDFFLLNVAALWGLTAFCRRENPAAYRRILACCINVFFGCLVFNDILALIQNSTGSTTILPFWLASRESGTQIGAFVGSTGRIAGIFVSPFRSGIQHALGLFLLTYRFKINGRLTAWEYVVLALVLAGSVLAASKAVLLGFLAVGVYLFYRNRFSVRTVCILAATLAAFVVVAIAWQADVAKTTESRQKWYSNLAPENVRSLDEAFYLYSAGRFNSSGTVYRDMKNCLARYPLTGQGLGNSEYSIDSGYNLMLFAGGVPLLGLYVAMLGYLFFSAYWRRKTRDPNVELLFFIAAFIVVADLGSPTLMQHSFGPTFSAFFFLLWRSFEPPMRAAEVSAILDEDEIPDEDEIIDDANDRQRRIDRGD